MGCPLVSFSGPLLFLSSSLSNCVSVGGVDIPFWEVFWGGSPQFVLSNSGALKSGPVRGLGFRV